MHTGTAFHNIIDPREANAKKLAAQKEAARKDAEDREAARLQAEAAARKAKKSRKFYAKDFKGLAWLFLGVANTDALLYDDEWKEIAEKYPEKFKYDVALSREMKNKDGGKLYIQDKVEEYADDIFTRLDNGAHIYFCGLKGMMPGIQQMLEKVAASKGIDYDEFIRFLKEDGADHRHEAAEKLIDHAHTHPENSHKIPRMKQK